MGSRDPSEVPPVLAEGSEPHGPVEEKLVGRLLDRAIGEGGAVAVSSFRCVGLARNDEASEPDGEAMQAAGFRERASLARARWGEGRRRRGGRRGAGDLAAGAAERDQAGPGERKRKGDDENGGEEKRGERDDDWGSEKARSVVARVAFLWAERNGSSSKNDLGEDRSRGGGVGEGRRV
ncbi:uncharacterized protein A4U43_C08F21100 [Asparagus officinalis]|nr:uncharacterized protein A4U43_C08F21100 [Asparagus officinalis]